MTQVVVTGTAQVFFQPRYKDQLEDFSAYLVAKPYWEINDPSLLALSEKLKDPKNVYDYVVSNLSYDMARVDQDLIRFGAKATLDSPKTALCMEFTDLFVALTRALKVPAREIEGYAQTNNEKRQPVSLRKDILHAWPEFYDRVSQTWRMVDPTWENTTGGINYFDEFDFNHIVFAIHGIDSVQPHPAGGYKTDVDTKDVLVNFEKTLPGTFDNLVVSSNLPDTVTSGFKHNFLITLENKGTKAVKISTLNVVSPDVQIDFEEKPELTIPPYGKRNVPLTLLYPSLFNSQRSIIAVNVNGKETSFTTEFVPASQRLEVIVPAVSALVGSVAGLLWFASKKPGNLSLFRRAR